MGNLSRLRELDVSFNELESIPEAVCLDASLNKLNVGKNFADLRMLPESLGNLKMLEDLDISDNQIKFLPDSFRFLSRLKNLYVDQTPLEVPPRHTTKLGAQAVVQYMAGFVAERDLERQQIKKKGGFFSYIEKDVTFEDRPVKILERPDKQLWHKTVPLVKVQWSRHGVEEATWELEEDMRSRHPELFDS